MAHGKEMKRLNMKPTEWLACLLAVVLCGTLRGESDEEGYLRQKETARREVEEAWAREAAIARLVSVGGASNEVAPSSLSPATGITEKEIAPKLWVLLEPVHHFPYIELELNTDHSCRWADNICDVCAELPIRSGRWSLEGDRLVLSDMKESSNNDGTGFSMRNRFYRGKEGLMLFASSSSITLSNQYKDGLFFRPVQDYTPKLLTKRTVETPKSETSEQRYLRQKEVARRAVEESRAAEAAMSNKFVIATGDLVSTYTNGWLHNAFYRVREGLGGMECKPWQTGMVAYARSTLTTKLPEHAIFLLVPTPVLLMTPGLDASRGIFADTPENRKKLQPYDQVLARLQAAALPESKAREFMVRYVAENYPDNKIGKIELTRKTGCWFVYVTWEPSGHFDAFFLGDGGKIIQAEGNM